MTGRARRPLYSACNEDTRSELSALDPRPEDTLVSIAAGGGRVLSLLTAGAAQVVAFDFKLDQLYTLDLKCAAMDQLSYEEFTGFVGLQNGRDRLDVYQCLRPSLTKSAGAYWDRRARLIEEGMLYCGRLESGLARYTRALRSAGFFRFPEIYFDVSTLEEQRVLLQRDRKRFDRGVRFWNLFCHPLAVYLTMQDPGFLRSTEGNVGRYLWSRLREYGQQHLFRESFLLRLIYHGRYDPAGPLPLYLTRQGFELAKKNLSRVETRHVRLEDLVERPPSAQRRKWSLSDVSCWLSRQGFEDMLATLVGNGSAGDRFCYRNFAARRPIPAGLRQRTRRLDDICDELDTTDSSVFFRFEVAEVREDGSALRK